MLGKGIAFAALMIVMLTAPARAEQTPVSVSVLSGDAKFIGSSMGGVNIILREAHSGEVLVRGRTKGHTGDTELIMAGNRQRDQVIRSEGSARFDASLNLKRPTLVRVEAFGPAAQPQSAVAVATEQVFIPGKDYAGGNGIVLTMPGMSVDILDPAAHLKLPFEAGRNLNMEVNVMKMCGCPVGEGLPWPPSRYEVEALIFDGSGESVARLPLRFAGENSRFEGKLHFSKAGAYTVYVTAFDPITKDSGVDATSVVLQ